MTRRPDRRRRPRPAGNNPDPGDPSPIDGKGPSDPGVAVSPSVPSDSMATNLNRGRTNGNAATTADHSIGDRRSDEVRQDAARAEGTGPVEPSLAAGERTTPPAVETPTLAASQDLPSFAPPAPNTPTAKTEQSPAPIGAREATLRSLPVEQRTLSRLGDQLAAPFFSHRRQTMVLLSLLVLAALVYLAVGQLQIEPASTSSIVG
jgi:hypothetical protein